MKTYTDTQAWTLLDRAFDAHPLLVLRAAQMLIKEKRHRGPWFRQFGDRIFPLLSAAGSVNGFNSKNMRGNELVDAAGQMQIKLTRTASGLTAIGYALCTSHDALSIIQQIGVDVRFAAGLCRAKENAAPTFDEKAPWVPAWAAVVINAELPRAQRSRLVALAMNDEAAQTALRIGGVAGLKAYAEEE